MRVWENKTVTQEMEDLGYSGSLNDKQFAYLRNAGRTNALADMQYQQRTSGGEPATPDPSSYVESFATTTFGTTHNFVTTDALTAGKYLIGILNYNGINQISGVTLEGTSGSIVGTGFNAEGRSIAFYEVEIEGGGNKTIAATVTVATNMVFSSIWKLGTRTYQSEDFDGAPHASGPVSATVQFNTTAGDEVFVMASHLPDPVVSTTNLNLRAANLLSNNRQLSVGDNLSATGGSPEDFVFTFSAGFDGEDIYAVHYS